MGPILASGGSLLSVDPGLFIWVLVTFIIFVLLFKKFAWGPILDALDTRETNIKESLEAAEDALKKAEKVSKENEAALREAEATAQSIRKEAIEEADKLRQARIDKAKEEAEKLIEDARSTIEKEKKQALLELRNEVASLAIEATQRIIHAELDQKKNKQLVDEFIDELVKN